VVEVVVGTVKSNVMGPVIEYNLKSDPADTHKLNSMSGTGVSLYVNSFSTLKIKVPFVSFKSFLFSGKIGN
jgi:hypothetical protein